MNLLNRIIFDTGCGMWYAFPVPEQGVWRNLMRRAIIALFLLIAMLLLVGSIFAQSPAAMISQLTHTSLWIWLSIIFGYYFILAETMIFYLM